MDTKNIVFIGKSLDGYIAGENGELDWLNMISNPKNIGMRYHKIMSEIDAVVIGKTTFETVSRFDIE